MPQSSGPARRLLALLVALAAVAVAATALVGPDGESDRSTPTDTPVAVPSEDARDTLTDLSFAVPRPTPEGPVVVVRGSGWGHSVGMSQYGAQGQALEGRTYRDILGHYYPGTAVTSDPAADETIHVGLFRNRGDIDASRLVVATSSLDGRTPDADVTVDLGAGTRVDVPFPRRWELRHDPDAPPELAFVLADHTGRERARGPGPARVDVPGRRTLLRLPQLAPGPRTRLAGTFRHGRLEVTGSAGRLRPVLALPVETYLGGLAEVPSWWHPESLKAQAVAGRTFAVRKVREGLDPGCGCHLGATPHDQVYAGWGKEGAWNGMAWRQAVTATAGEVVTFDGELAWTYYSSSHGGASEDSGDSWAYGHTLPYLRHVEDPWSLRPEVGNPYAAWERRIPTTEFARAVGLADVHRVEITARTPGGTPLELRLEGVDAAGAPVVAGYRGLERGVAGAALKLHFRALLPSQQISEFEVVRP